MDNNSEKYLMPEDFEKEEDFKKVTRLMEMSKLLYSIHKELKGYKGNITTLRQDLLKICAGLERLRSQILSGEEEPFPEND